jgi:glycosyltransferase involved in cell wall biosynthesis
MKLCLLADAPSIHTRRWAEYFAGRGHEVHLLSMRPAAYSRVTVHRIGPPLGKGGHLLAGLAARRRIQALAPDLVHAHYASSYGLWGAICGRRPFLLSVWGSDVFEFPHQGALQRRLLAWNLSCADVLCATSEALARETALYAPPSASIHLTPFGVDTARFRPRPGPPGREGLVIGTARNLHRTYGLDVLLDAFARLTTEPAGVSCGGAGPASTRPNGEERARGSRWPTPLSLWIAGDGPEDAALKQQAIHLGIADRVQFFGALEHDRMLAFLWGLDLFVNPSRAESFGVAALEAAASGLPVVASRVGGLPEVVADGETGLLVPPADPAALAQAIASLIDDPARRRALGRAARERAVTRYDWQSCARAMERLYQETVSGCPRPTASPPPVAPTGISIR